MDLLTKIAAQFSDMFRSMTPGARWTSALLLIAIVVSVAFLFRHPTSGTEDFLFGGELCSQSEIASMEAAFAKASLNGWTIEGNRIKVPRNERHKYLAAIADAGALPDNFSSAIDSMIAKANPFESRAMQEIKFRVAREREFSYVVRKMPGVRNAKVTVEEVQLGGFPPRKERRVLVAVEAEGSRSLTEDLVRSIRYSVAAGMAVPQEHVTVSDLNSGRAYPGREGGAPGSDENLYASTKRMFEGLWRDKILEQLAMIQGVSVGVNVELDPEINNQVSSLKFDKDPTSVEVKTFTKEANSTASETGGRPGAVPNGVVGNTPRSVTDASRNQSTSNESHEEQKYTSGRTQTLVQRASLTPRSVTAAVRVPSSYFEKVWRQQNPALDGQETKKPDPAELTAVEEREKKKIQSLVNNLLPKAATNEDTIARVEVQTYYDLPQPTLELPGTADQVLGWLGANWTTLMMIGVGLFALSLLRGAFRAGPAPAPALGLPLPASAGESAGPIEEEPEESETSQDRRLRFQSSGRSLREELVELVREDPEAAANVLKNWIRDAA